NGSWASKAGDLMEQFVKEELKNMTILDERICIASSACEDKALELDAMADCIVASLKGELA
ncbi:MAG: FprA family A-type flavoprotein, partial [Lachnospiraceae bacterium]|nr:FprA family A-type flavoprotein [Lachnospiraceae bacterium]